jgi:hypothetical protein
VLRVKRSQAALSRHDGGRGAGLVLRWGDVMCHGGRGGHVWGVGKGLCGV